MEILNAIWSFLCIHPTSVLCDPVSGLILTTSLIGTGVQAYSSMKQGQAAEQAANYNANVAAQNAVASRQQAVEDERGFRVQTRQMLGDIRSGYAASGVTLEGSPEDVLYQSASNAELDALKIRHGGELKAMGYENSAALSIMEGANARDSGYLSAAGILLKGSADAAGRIKWSK